MWGRWWSKVLRASRRAVLSIQHPERSLSRIPTQRSPRDETFGCLWLQLPLWVLLSFRVLCNVFTSCSSRVTTWCLWPERAADIHWAWSPSLALTTSQGSWVPAETGFCLLVFGLFVFENADLSFFLGPDFSVCCCWLPSLVELSSYVETIFCCALTHQAFWNSPWMKFSEICF